jgi:hypothetical protein
MSLPLTEVYATLLEAHDQVARLHGELDNASPDSAFACGEALGVLAKAMGLIGRDIDSTATKAT